MVERRTESSGGPGTAHPTREPTEPEFSGGLGTVHPTRAARPVVTPDAYTGDSSWTDWADHFEAVAKVNSWDDSIKLNWLPVRLMGKAQAAWKRLSDETKGDFQAAMDALRNRFEPSSKRERYAAEFRLRKRKNEEQWGDFADQLRCLADKAFPTLSEDAKEVLTLDSASAQRPETLEEAVSCTLEMESYALLRKEEPTRVAALLDSITKRLEKLEHERNTDQLPSGKATAKKEEHEKKELKESGKLTAPRAEDHAQEGLRKVQSSFVVTNFAVNPSKSYFITAFVHQIPLTLMIDTEAAVSLLGKEQWMRLGGAKFTMEQWNGETLIPLETAGSGEHVDLVCQARATLMENVTVPAWSEVEVLASTNSLCGSGTWLVEGLRDKNVPQVLVAGAVVKPIQDRELVCIPVRMVNPSPVAVTVYKGMAVEVAERIADSHIAAAVHDVLADKDEELGRTAVVQHSIVTGDAPPIKQPSRPIPVARQHEVRKLLDEILQKDVIQPSASPWASPVVLVQKKDGTMRFCIDYRKLNAVTRKDAYPLPRIDETLEVLGGSKWFSTLDLLSGYWQVEVS
eukprot:Em0001g272a